MRIAILSCGAIVVKEDNQSWLFGAPRNVKYSLERAGIESPEYLFTTSLTAPGWGHLGKDVRRFKEESLSMNGLSAVALERKHGTDYEIVSKNAKILFSERGDVSVSDVTGYDIAIVKNKHRPDKFDDSVITWPWPDVEYSIKSHVSTPIENDLELAVQRMSLWQTLDDVPAQLKDIDGIPLTLDQANVIGVASQTLNKGDYEAGIQMFKTAYTVEEFEEGPQWALKQVPKKKPDDPKPVEAESSEPAKSADEEAPKPKPKKEPSKPKPEAKTPVPQADTAAISEPEINPEESEEKKPASEVDEKPKKPKTTGIRTDPDIRTVYFPSKKETSIEEAAPDDTEGVPIKSKEDAGAFMAWKQAKISKDVANYRSVEPGDPSPNKLCGNCAFFMPINDRDGSIGEVGSGACRRVAGRIYASDICDLWESVGITTKDILRNSEGRTANDHLVVEDKDKVTTWHLPVGKDGKYDPKLMGGAAASLAHPSGYRGNKYAGPSKEEAIRKLADIYSKLERQMPEHLEEASKELDASGKEMTSQGPVQRFGDVLTADLHTAYNNVSDRYYRLGYMNQDERKKIGQAVGNALKALHASAPQVVMERIVNGTEVPEILKEVLPDIPDRIGESGWVGVYKDIDGIDRWASVSSVAAWDRQGEYFTTDAMDWAIAFSKITGIRGPLRFKHIPGLDGGDCDTQIRVGEVLFEGGTFRDNMVGRQMKTILRTDPDWQMSIGLAYGKDDIDSGRYKRAAIFERSMTKKPALSITAITIKSNDENLEAEQMVISEKKLREAADELGLGFEQVKDLYERALAVGNVFGLKEFKEVAYKELIEKAATPTNAGGANASREDNVDGDEEVLKKRGKRGGSVEDDDMDYDEKADYADDYDEDDDEDDEVPMPKRKKEIRGSGDLTASTYNTMPKKRKVPSNYSKVDEDAARTGFHAANNENIRKGYFDPGYSQAGYKEDEFIEERETLKSVVAGLSDFELEELYDVLEEVEKESEDEARAAEKAGRDYDEDMDYDEDVPKRKKKGDYDRELDIVHERVNRIESAITEQTKEFKDLIVSLATGGGVNQGQVVQDAITQAMNGVPRRQASNFASGAQGFATKESPQFMPERFDPDTTDSAIREKLEAIEVAVKHQAQQQAQPGMYDAFTSRNLNRPRDERF